MKIIRGFFLGIVFIYVLGLAVALQLRLLMGDSLWWLSLINQFAPFLFIPLIVTFIVALLFRSWLLVAIQIVFIVIALVWFGPAFLPKSPEIAANADTLTIVTFNISPSNRSMDDVTTWVNEQDADIVLIQDAGRYTDFAHLTALSAAYEFQAQDNNSNGNMILSRYPVSSVQTFDLDRDERNEVQQALVDINGAQVTVYNVHFDSPIQSAASHPSNWMGRFSPYVFDEEQHNQQLEGLLNLIANSEQPVIAAGDFNMSAYAARYNEIASLLTDSFAEAGEGFGFTWETPVSSFQSIPPVLRLDYVWHSGDFTAVDARTGPVIGSDHLPVVVELALTPEN